MEALYRVYIKLNGLCHKQKLKKISIARETENILINACVHGSACDVVIFCSRGESECYWQSGL